MAQVFLSGLRKDDNTVLLPLPSAAVLFVTKYCDFQNVSVTLVNNAPRSDCVTMGNLDDMQFCEETGNDVRSCDLPLMEEDGGQLIRSGLCSVIRQIINLAHIQNPGENFKDLLGFRGGSLKACAEQSGWTKLCEVELPRCVTDLWRSIREEKKSLVELPEDMMKLEWHFYKAARVHNDDKKKRKLLLQVKEEAKQMCDPSTFKFERDIELPHCNVRYQIHRNRKTEGKVHSVKPNENSPQLPNKCTNGDLRDIPPRPTDHTAQEEPFDSMEVLTDFLKNLTIFEIDYMHLYSEGESITVADLILFNYMYYFMESLTFSRSNLADHIPKIMGWIDHMITLPRIQQAAQHCGFRLKDLSKGDTKVIPEVDFFVSPTVQELAHEDDMELSRRCRAKYRAIKPDVTFALNKIKSGNIEVNLGAHPRGENVQLEWNKFPDGVHPGTDLPKERLNRKCQQLENLVTAVVDIAKPGDIIVDFCCGGGHLGIAVAYLLPDCKVYLIENNEMSLIRARDRVIKANLNNVTAFQCNQDYFHGKFDIGVCLHACGTATDMVLQQSLDNNASFVICPCCYGGIQNTHLMSYPRSQYFRSADIPYKAFLTLGHAADQTEFNISHEEQGKYCMNLVDTDRASLACEKGYSVTLCSLTPLSCTPKNNMLIGQPKTTL